MKQQIYLNNGVVSYFHHRDNDNLFNMTKFAYTKSRHETTRDENNFSESKKF